MQDLTPVRPDPVRGESVDRVAGHVCRPRAGSKGEGAEYG